jgi:hypothetical protein
MLSRSAPLTAATAFDALAHVTASAIAQFNGLMRAGGGTRWHHCAAHGSVFEVNIDFHGRVATAVEDFPSGNIDNGGHGVVPCQVPPGGVAPSYRRRKINCAPYGSTVTFAQTPLLTGVWPLSSFLPAFELSART